MAAAKGLVLTFGAFAASFALHVVGGATDLGWLFALAVVLIYLTAAGFPALALAIGQVDIAQREGMVTLVAGSVLGVVLTGGALWAANDRAFAPWHVVGAPGLVIGVSAGLLLLGRLPVGSRLFRKPLTGA